MRSLLPRSFRGQLLALMIAFITVATLVLGWMAYRAARESLSEQAISAVGEAANDREVALLRYLRSMDQAADRFLVSLQEVCAPLDQGQARCMAALLRGFGVPRELVAARVTRNGQEIASFGEAADLAEASVPRDDELARFRREPDGGCSFVARAREGDLELRIRASCETVKDIFRDNRGLGESGETFLVDEEGFLLTPPRYPDGAKPARAFDAAPLQMCLNGQEGEMVAPDYRGVEVVHGFRYVPEIGDGCIAAHIDREEAAAPARALRLRVIGAAAAFALVALVVSFWFARRLSGSMSELTRRARALEGGDFESPFMVKGPEEIKTFARTFAGMARSIKQSQQHQHLLVDIGVALDQSFDVQTTLARVAHLVVPVMADWCAVTIAGDGDRRIALAHRDPEKEREVSRLLEARELKTRLPLGAEEVMKRGEPQLIPELDEQMLEAIVRTYPRVESLVREKRPISLMSVPMKLGDRGLGAITFVSTRESGRRYGREDLSYAEMIATRCALAMERAFLYEEAQQAVRARDDFLSIASHELKTPLTPLQIQIHTVERRIPDLVRDVESRAWFEKRLEIMRRQGVRLNRLVSELLDISRIAGGRLALDLAMVDLAEVVEQVRTDFDEQGLIRLSKSEVRVDSARGVIGRWDRLRVEQVVANLLSNALKYGFGKPVAVTTEASGDSAVLTISDQGIGVDPEQQERIFGRFERSASSRHYGGLGLGLYIARELVEAMGGTIRVESSVGAGATFIVVLPFSGPGRSP